MIYMYDISIYNNENVIPEGRKIQKLFKYNFLSFSFVFASIKSLQKHEFYKMGLPS